MKKAMQRNLLLLTNLSKRSNLTREDVSELLEICITSLKPGGKSFDSPLRVEYLVELNYIRAKIEQKLHPDDPSSFVHFIGETILLAPEVKREGYLIVEALVDLTEHFIERHEITAAKDSLSRAKHHMKNNCDFEKPLSRKLHALSDRLNGLLNIS